MKEIFVNQQQYDMQARLPAVSILYFCRLSLVALATIGIAIEPHTFYGHGYPVVDYTMLFVSFTIAIILMCFLFKRSKYFFYITHILFGYNTTLMILTLTPYFIEENVIMPFLCAIDFCMVLYLHRSARAAMYYGYRKIVLKPENSDSRIAET